MYNELLVRIAIAGVSGRMGKNLVNAALQMNNISISVALDRKVSSSIGIDVGELVRKPKVGITIQDSLVGTQNDFDVFVDFTNPKATLQHLEFCQKYSKPMVIGTTGFDDLSNQIIHEASNDIAIVLAANFSIGMNIMLKLIEKTTKLIGNFSDIEIIEKHHRHKFDSPSGTALVIGRSIANALNKDLKDCTFPSKDKSVKKRALGNICFSSVRAGDIIGEHTVMFVNIGEYLEITHKVSNRMVFANGALRSAIWINKKKSGFFTMENVLNL